MSSKLKRLQNIDQTTKDVVSGFIREYQKILALSEYNLFHHIPLLIPSLSTLYADASDYFILNKDVKLLKNGREIDGLENDVEFGVCRGSAIIPSIINCKARWVLKVRNVPDPCGTRMVICVADIKTVFNQDYDDMEGECYCYSSYGWAKKQRDGDLIFPPSFDSGDEIAVELDLLSDIPNVKFFKNGYEKITKDNQLFIKKKDDTSKYQLVVVVYHKDVQVSLINMCQEFGIDS